MWNELMETWESPGTVEYGVYQRATKSGTPLWRRHSRGRRFASVKAALFAAQGARNACLGTAQYARDRYSNSELLALPYAATWLRGESHAFLVRASTPEPEVTVVRSEDVDNIFATSEAQLTRDLARLFGQGADQYGVRVLSAGEQLLPVGSDG